MKIYDAEKMVEIKALKQILRKKQYIDRRFRLIDVSGVNSFGYEFELVEQVKTLHTFKDENGKFIFQEYFFDTVRKIASSIDTSFPTHRNMMGGVGAYGPAFNRADIAEVLSGTGVL